MVAPFYLTISEVDTVYFAACVADSDESHVAIGLAIRVMNAWRLEDTDDSKEEDQVMVDCSTSVAKQMNPCLQEDWSCAWT